MAAGVRAVAALGVAAGTAGAIASTSEAGSRVSTADETRPPATGAGAIRSGPTDEGAFPAPTPGFAVRSPTASVPAEPVPLEPLPGRSPLPRTPGPLAAPSSPLLLIRRIISLAIWFALTMVFEDEDSIGSIDFASCLA